jgi:site-specific DNA recombinase
VELHKIRAMLNDGKNIFDLPLKVVYYARVSTEKDAQLNSLENQIFYYEDFIKKNPNWIFCGGYIDEGISAISATKRENFLKMIEDGNNKKFDLIITKEISRFSRSTLDSIKYTQELLLNGIGVYFQSDNINTLMPDAELRLTIMASIAQEEVRKLSERTKFGFKRSVEKGRVLGNKRILGFDKQDGRLTINEKEAKIVHTIFKLYATGLYGTRRMGEELAKLKIFNEMGKPYACSAISGIIQNPKYKGYYCGNKSFISDYRAKRRIKNDPSEWVVYKDNNIPIIVEEDLWDRCNSIYQQRSKKSKSHDNGYQNRYSYSGKIICAEHGTSFHRDVYGGKKEGEKECWQCKIYRQKGKSGCQSPTLYTTELDEIMTKINTVISENKEEIFGIWKNDLYEAFENQDYKREIVKKQNQQITLQNKKEKLLELVVEGLIDKKEFVERNVKCNQEIEKIDLEIEELQNKERQIKDVEKYYNDMKNHINNEWDNEVNPNNVLLDKIIVHKTNLEGTIDLEILMRTRHRFGAKLFNKEHIITLNTMNKNLCEMIQTYHRPFKGEQNRKLTYNITIKLAC